MSAPVTGGVVRLLQLVASGSGTSLRSHWQVAGSLATTRAVKVAAVPICTVCGSRPSMRTTGGSTATPAGVLVTLPAALVTVTV